MTYHMSQVETENRVSGIDFHRFRAWLPGHPRPHPSNSGGWTRKRRQVVMQYLLHNAASAAPLCFNAHKQILNTVSPNLGRGNILLVGLIA